MDPITYDLYNYDHVIIFSCNHNLWLYISTMIFDLLWISYIVLIPLYNDQYRTLSC